MNIIVTSHGDLCLGLVDSLEMLAGKQKKVESLSLSKEDTGQFKEHLRSLVQEKIAEPTLILCDIVGGTPYNESYQLFLENPDVLRIVSGVNLAMLTECALSLVNDLTLEELVEVAITSGNQSIQKAQYDNDIEDDDIQF